MRCDVGRQRRSINVARSHGDDRAESCHRPPPPARCGVWPARLVLEVRLCLLRVTNAFGLSILTRALRTLIPPHRAPPIISKSAALTPQYDTLKHLWWCCLVGGCRTYQTQINSDDFVLLFGNWRLGCCRNLACMGFKILLIGGEGGFSSDSFLLRAYMRRLRRMLPSQQASCLPAPTTDRPPVLPV